MEARLYVLLLAIAVNRVPTQMKQLVLRASHAPLHAEREHVLMVIPIRARPDSSAILTVKMPLAKER